MRTRPPGSPALALLVLVPAFYVYTLAPSVTWGDGVKLQTEVALGGSVYMFLEETRHVATDGLPFDRLGAAAIDHPLYVMLGQLFLALPWGDLAFRVNLMSALMATAAIALTYHVGLFLVRDRCAAVLGALALAVSHTFWWHAVTAEVYALHLVFMISLIGLAWRWTRYRRWRSLALFAWLAGLGLANHLMLGLTLLPVLAYMVGAVPARDAGRWLARAAVSSRGLACIALFLVGLAPWWIQFIRMAGLIGMPLSLQLAAGFPWLPGSLLLSSAEALLVNLLKFAAWLTYQFTPAGIALGLYGAVRLRSARPREARLLIALFVVHAAFSANYRVPDQFTFHVPSYLIFALFMMEGLSGFLLRLDAHPQVGQGWRRAMSHGALAGLVVATPVAIYSITPPTLHALGITDATLDIWPIGTGARDALSVFLDPNERGDDSAARFGRSTLEGLAPDAWVFTPNNVDGEAYLVLRYFQLVERLRPDVHFELMLFRSPEVIPHDILALARAHVACRPVYLASLNPEAYPIARLQAEFEISPQVNLFRLVPRDPPATRACPEPDRSRAAASLEQIITDMARWR